MTRRSFRRFAPVVYVLLIAPAAFAQTPPRAPPVPDAAPADVLPPPRPASDDPPSSVTPPAASPAPSFGGPGGDLMGGRMGMMGGPGPMNGPMPALFNYRATWFPDEPVAGQGTHLGYEQQDFALAAPIWQDGCDLLSASASVRAETFSTGAILPTTGERFPSELYDVHLGTAFQHSFDNGWVGGANVSVGSASDRPFDAIRDMTIGATASLRVPQGERNAWLFSLNYSTNSQVLYNIPIPGVAYFYNPTDWFQATVGFPFAAATLRPTDDLSFQFSYALLTNIHAKALYRLAPAVRVYGGFDWWSESYLRAERQDDRDRFDYEYKQVGGGVQVLLSRQADLDFSSGYDFDRFYYEGTSFSDQHRNRVDVGDGPFVGARLSLRY